MSPTVSRNTFFAVMRTNNSHERRKKDEELQDGEETACKKEYRDDSGQVGNPEGSGEYLSEIDILSPLTSSPERSSMGIRLNLLYKNLNSFVSFSVESEEAALSLHLSLPPSLPFSSVFLLAPPRVPRSSFIDPVSGNISFICKTHDLYRSRLALHFSFSRYFFPYISNDRL